MNIYFLSKCKFPYVSASSLRNVFLGSLFNNDDKCFFIGKRTTYNGKWTDFEYGKYIGLGNAGNFLNKILDEVLFERRLLSLLKHRKFASGDIIVVCYFFSSWFLKKIVQICKKQNIKLIFSITERFSRCEFNFFSYSYFSLYLPTLSIYSFLNKNKFPIIAISRYLYNFFTGDGHDCVYVPFVFDSKYKVPILYKPIEFDGLKLVYAGSPGNKDLLVEMIESVCFLISNNFNIVFNIFGVTERWFMKKKKMKKNLMLPKNIIFHGFCKKEEIYGAIEQSDFSVLLRPDNEIYAKAGFPTKVSESLFLGTPVITNFTSDLKFFLKDGLNSIKVESGTKDSFINALKKAISLNESDIILLKKNARETYKSMLTTEKYKEDFDKFIKLVKGI